jgi:glycosyltransferase involved in cell wall biosynthesis
MPAATSELQAIKSYLDGYIRFVSDPANRELALANTKILACAKSIEMASRIPSRVPSFLHPLLRLWRQKTIARTTAEAFRHISDILVAGPGLRVPLQDRVTIASAPQDAPSPRLPLSRTRLLVDVTYTNWADSRTGIQRVVRNLAREIVSQSGAEFDALLVHIQNGQLRVCSDFYRKLKLTYPPKFPETTLIVPDHADVFLAMDSGWPILADYLQVFASLKEAQARIVSIVYDLIPLTHPEFMPSQETVRQFARWLAVLLSYSSDLVAISASVAQTTVEYASDLPSWRHPIPVGFFHLGASNDRELSVGHTPHDVRRFAALRRSCRHLFLMVGTVEARKNYGIVLQAFEQLWSDGISAGLLIIGKPGWRTDELQVSLRKHPASGVKLGWLTKAGDSELGAAYRNCDCLVAASLAEGFGLPLIEASSHGIPIVASDISVFREICQQHATYFPATDAAALAQVLRDWVARKEAGKVLSSSGMRHLTWTESTQMLLDAILHPKLAPQAGPGQGAPSS